MNKGLAALLSEIATSNDDDESDNPKFKPLHQQKTLLQGFLEHSAEVTKFKIGDSVERTENGKYAVKGPREGQIAVIASVFDKPMLDENGRLMHGEIAMIHRDGHLLTHVVDFRWYKKVKK